MHNVSAILSLSNPYLIVLLSYRHHAPGYLLVHCRTVACYEDTALAVVFKTVRGPIKASTFQNKSTYLHWILPVIELNIVFHFFSRQVCCECQLSF